jgi:hypothetical protein
MCRWRYETQRHLPRFSVHWKVALAEIGHINCPMMDCNYISLSEADMFNHYLHCDGVSFHGNRTAIHRGVVCTYQVYLNWRLDWGVLWTKP